MWKSERSPRWFSTEMNCSADGRYFTSTRYSCYSPLSPRCEMRKSGEKSSRPKRSGEDCGRRNGATSYRARRKIDSTRASAMRLLASRRSIPPPWPRNLRQTRAVVIVSFDLRVSRPQIHGSLPANPGGCMTGAGDRMSRRQWLAAGAALAGYALAAAPSLAKAVRTDKAGLATAQAEITGSGVAMPVDEARLADAAKAPIVVLEAIRRRGAGGQPERGDGRLSQRGPRDPRRLQATQTPGVVHLRRLSHSRLADSAAYRGVEP